MSRIVASAMICPDGTVLQSYHVHDYKEHTDKNGETYVLDGGAAYVRTSVNNEPAQYITVHEDDPHHLKRKWFAWGTRGKDGQQPLRWLALEDMDQDHIEAILETQHQIQDWTRQLLKDELQWRKGHDMLDTLVQLSQEQGDYS